MNPKDQLRLQAWLDKELSAPEAEAVAAWVRGDEAAAALAAELRRTGGALATGEPQRRLPESREFYWSKIEREIRRRERLVPLEAGVGLPWWLRWLRLSVPATALAGLAVGLLVALHSPDTGLGRVGAGSLMTAQGNDNTFTYRDYDAGATLVWISYPAENELAAKKDPDTLN